MEERWDIMPGGQGEGSSQERRHQNRIKLYNINYSNMSLKNNKKESAVRQQYLEVAEQTDLVDACKM